MQQGRNWQLGKIIPGKIEFSTDSETAGYNKDHNQLNVGEQWNQDSKKYTKIEKTNYTNLQIQWGKRQIKGQISVILCSFSDLWKNVAVFQFNVSLPHCTL